MTARQDQLQGPKRELLNKIRATYRKNKLDIHWKEVFVTETASGLMPTVRGVPVPLNFFYVMYHPCPNRIDRRRAYVKQWRDAYNSEMAPLMLKDPGAYVRWHPEETYPSKAFPDELYEGTREMRHKVAKAIADYVAIEGDRSADATEPAEQPTASCSLPAAGQGSATTQSSERDDSLQEFEQPGADNNNNNPDFKDTGSEQSYDPEKQIKAVTSGGASASSSDVEIID